MTCRAFSSAVVRYYRVQSFYPPTHKLVKSTWVEESCCPARSFWLIARLNNILEDPCRFFFFVESISSISLFRISYSINCCRVKSKLRNRQLNTFFVSSEYRYLRNRRSLRPTSTKVGRGRISGSAERRILPVLATGATAASTAETSRTIFPQLWHLAECETNLRDTVLIVGLRKVTMSRINYLTDR